MEKGSKKEKIVVLIVDKDKKQESALKSIGGGKSTPRSKHGCL